MEYNIYINAKKISKASLSALEEYKKRLSVSVKVNIYYGKQTKITDISKNDFIYDICTGNTSYDSVELSKQLYSKATHGVNKYAFLIGYENIEYNEVLSLSSFDISPDILGIMLVEQLYRAYTIDIGKTYHK